MAETTKVALLAAQGMNSIMVRELLDSIEYIQVEEKAMGTGSALDYSPKDVDCVIISMPDEYHVTTATDDFSLPASNRPIIYVLPDQNPKARLWAYRHGASSVLVPPFHTNTLWFHIERAVSNDRMRFDRLVREETMVTFLKKMLGEENESIQPALEPDMPYGHFYPDVARLLGRTPCDIDFLEHMANEGVLSREVYNRVRICPVCDEMGINYREVCAKCSSVNIHQVNVIHHFSCAHVGSETSFRQGEKLICPKCGQELFHIGTDYERPTKQYECRDCDHLFPEPKIEAQCLWCGITLETTQTIARTIYSYKLTPLARQAVEDGQIRGLELRNLLENQETGLYTRQFTYHQARREFTRSIRNKNPFSIVMVRIDNLQHVRLQKADQAREFAQRIFMAISKNLRQLDLTCVWDTNILAVVLPDTPGEGASIVAKRMHNNVMNLDNLSGLGDPEISISMVAFRDSFQNIDAMFEHAYEDLNA